MLPEFFVFPPPGWPGPFPSVRPPSVLTGRVRGVRLRLHPNKRFGARRTPAEEGGRLSFTPLHPSQKSDTNPLCTQGSWSEWARAPRMESIRSESKVENLCFAPSMCSCRIFRIVRWSSILVACECELPCVSCSSGERWMIGGVLYTPAL